MTLNCTARALLVAQMRMYSTRTATTTSSSVFHHSSIATSRISRAQRQHQFSSVITASAADTEVAAEPAPASSGGEADVTKLDIRVGKIISVEAHPDADSLYVEQIDVGEPEGPRTIVSGLREYVKMEDLQDRSVLILANLKPRNMRGIKSNGMLLCASDSEHTTVEPLSPPEGAVVGERVFFGEGGEDQPDAALPNQLQKKKFWEACQPLLKTGADKVAGFEGKTMMTSAGPVVTATLGDANIS